MAKFFAPKELIVYEDDKVGVCMASHPITHGHVIVFWRDDVKDINNLSRIDYEYLMDIVDVAREAMLKTFNVEKVYLVYMDEIEHVHWHLVPRYEEKGFNMLSHTPKEIIVFPDIDRFKSTFQKLKSTDK